MPRHTAGRHVEIVVISKEFEGKSAVNRQRMVYKVGAGRCQAGASRGGWGLNTAVPPFLFACCLCLAGSVFACAGLTWTPAQCLLLRAPQTSMRRLALLWCQPMLTSRTLTINTPPPPHTHPCCPQAIWEELQETVHAVDAMVTKTPEEAGM